MKEYRVKPENFNAILLNRLPAFLRVVVFSIVIGIPYLYYLHPRRGPYENWSEFFDEPGTKVVGVAFGISMLIGLVWGIYIGRKSLQTLVVSVHDDHVAWRVFKEPTKNIFFHDLLITSDAAGITLTSKMNRRVTLKVPRQIEDFTELESLLKQSIL